MKRVLSIVLISLLLCGCQNDKTVDLQTINDFKYDEVSDLPFDLYSQEYMLVRASDFSVLYKKDTDKRIYPASLTKIMTLDTILHCVNNLDETSYVSSEQVQELIAEDASLAYIHTDTDYSIRDLLYALILPSGADGAVALENYFTNHNMNLIDEMKKQLINLGCNDTNFMNTTGLHDDNHYTTLDDLLKIVIDILRYDEGRRLLETKIYTMKDGTRLYSSVAHINNNKANILGGKTGYTPESGQSVIVLYTAKNRSYILLLANAMGDPHLGQHWNYEDAIDLINKLY